MSNVGMTVQELHDEISRLKEENERKTRRRKRGGS